MTIALSLCDDEGVYSPLDTVASDPLYSYIYIYIYIITWVEAEVDGCWRMWVLFPQDLFQEHEAEVD